MKSKFAKWANLSVDPYKNRTAIKVIKLPGFRRLEDMLLGIDLNGNTPVGFEKALAAVCKSTFGIEPRDLEIEEPEHIRDLPDEHPKVQGYLASNLPLLQRYYTADVPDEDAAAMLQKMGLDLFDERGQPLRLTRFVALVAEHVARGFGGTMPSPADVGLEDAERNLEREAREWAKAKRRSG